MPSWSGTPRRSVKALTKPSGLPDQLRLHVCDIGHPGKVEHQVDIVVHIVTRLGGNVNDNDILDNGNLDLFLHLIAYSKNAIVFLILKCT